MVDCHQTHRNLSKNEPLAPVANPAAAIQGTIQREIAQRCQACDHSWWRKERSLLVGWARSGGLKTSGSQPEGLLVSLSDIAAYLADVLKPASAQALVMSPALRCTGKAGGSFFRDCCHRCLR